MSKKHDKSSDEKLMKALEGEGLEKLAEVLKKQAEADKEDKGKK